MPSVSQPASRFWIDRDWPPGYWVDTDESSYWPQGHAVPAPPPSTGDVATVYRLRQTAAYVPGPFQAMVYPDPYQHLIASRATRYPSILHTEIEEDAEITLLAYVRNTDGTAIQQAHVSSISYTVFDRRTGLVVSGHDGVSLSVSSYIYDTLQTSTLDPRWATTGGANFIHTVPSSAFPEPARSYIYTASLVNTDSESIRISAVISVINKSNV